MPTVNCQASIAGSQVCVVASFSLFKGLVAQLVWRSPINLVVPDSKQTQHTSSRDWLI